MRDCSGHYAVHCHKLDLPDANVVNFEPRVINCTFEAVQNVHNVCSEPRKGCASCGDQCSCIFQQLWIPHWLLHGLDESQ